ncbi:MULTISPECIES: penicillin-binding protein 2 [Caballeronia]|uniref:Peptidoglycan D,D-transpeptidase FtsI n=1 Tax=Caballeronia zhejiangensis TaxID=871203 RepID=A0A656QPB8_9BURK|nr:MULTISPECIES: penicillin-binding protein 2 [Caballeronia]EKS66733.1 penicillin-binding protein [Burkholderia sp. SJ98]KDR30993.1 cell division protein [Caballeronia zhejiangensis]MDR5768587.1 penicillin-binding protein 2 [Caballeronia sp. LZ028]MDR5789988.1 penicillin-binding protein 2 [Caballeronia sp. LP003]MDR5797304.1 penicillin-binding protein 2 [Caballeronia sp. LZ008]
MFKKKTRGGSDFQTHHRSAVLANRLPAWRSRLVVIGVTAAFLTLAGRALWVQVIDHKFYIGEGQKRYQRTLALSATRGRIVDRNGAMLAVSLATYEVWATPKLFDGDHGGEIARLLDMPPKDLQRRIDGTRAFVLLKRQVEAETAERIATIGRAGITLVPDTKRFYPEGESAAHVVGFTNNEDHGQEGVELAADARLTGAAGQREVIRDRLGRVVSQIGEPAMPQNGETIQLTIDRRIQQLAHSQLKAAIAKHKARAGSVVVLDAKNGEVLALANYPSFDPNDRSRLTGEQLRNRALTDTFEPGSTIKPLVAALSIDLGRVRPETRIDTSPGTFKLGPNVIHDTSNHGVITVSEAVQMSSNVALTKLALQIPAQTIWDKYREYGIGRAPELTFPGAATGRLRAPERWKPIEQATMAYGYGLSLSLVQIAQIYTAYAGDGRFYPATLIHGETRRDAVQVTKPATAKAVRNMLENATGDHGTGRAAAVEGYRVGGKTGTARKQVGRSYAANKYRASFVGIAPMSDPRVIVAVMIDEPTGGTYYGGTVAGPVFSGIVGATLPLLGVPPDA